MKHCRIESSGRIRDRVALISLAAIFLVAAPARGAQAGTSSPSLQVSQVSPTELAAGSEATLTITGTGFTKGCYVSFSSPSIRVISTRFDNVSRLEAKVKVGEKAEGGSVTLYVSSAEGVSAQIPFTVVVTAPAPARPASVNTNAPIVSSVEPPRAAPGSQLTVKIKGRNFAKDAKVSFSNPGIEVAETNVSKSTEISAKLKVAPDAATGPCGLFVVNPDESEVEGSFSVTGANGGSASAGTAATKPASPASAPSERFNVINLGDAISVLQKSGKPQGTLMVTGNHLEYDEQGKKVFSASASEVKEVASNVFFGINTGTFHIILNSGKTYNFISSSLSPDATQAIVDSLQRALH